MGFEYVLCFYDGMMHYWFLLTDSEQILYESVWTGLL